MNLFASSPPCNYSRRLELYLDGELPSQERPSVETHLATCANCREQLQSLQALRRTLQQNVVPWAPLSSDGEFWRQLAPRLLPRREKEADEAAPFWAPLGLVISNVALQGVAVLVSVVFLLYRWQLLPASLAGALSSAGQFLVGPLLWQAGQSLSANLGGVLPDTWTLSADTGYVMFETTALGLMLVLSGLYVAWLVHWLRTADRIKQCREASYEQNG